MARRLSRGIILLVVLMAAFVAPSILASAPTGAGPNDPLMVTGTWQTRAPNASVWYYFDYGAGTDRYPAQVALDTNGVSNIGLAIYTPAQASAWLQDSSTRPVGIGTPPGSNTAAAIHDLVWQGAFNTSGRYFAVVTNKNASPVSYRLLVSGASVKLAPPPTATPYPTPLFNTPVPTGNIDGKLVFQDASGGSIYTVHGDGSQLTRVTYGLDPAWSPDGKQIAFARWNYPAGVFIANADGSNERSLFGANQILSPQWSPDASRIVFTRQKGGTPASSFCFGSFCFSSPANQYWKLSVVTVSDGALFDPSSTNHSFSPTWGPDNQTVAFADGQFGILTTNARGGAPTTIFSQNPDVQSPKWSPDGSTIAFEVRQHDHWEINVVNADGGNVTQVTQANPFSFAPVNNVAPTWSPDSKQILFLSDRNGKWEFFTVNPDGSGLKQVLKSVTDSVAIHYNFMNERVIDWTK